MTDLYQITMAYAYWKSNRHNDRAVFELFFRKNPFKGEYTIFCGLDEVLKHLCSFKFKPDDIEYLRNCPALTHCDPAFFDEYLAALDCSEVKLYAASQGRMMFPRVPLLIVVAPLGIGQLLETTLLSLTNFPSLVATNAARMVVAAKGLNELGHHEEMEYEQDALARKRRNKDDPKIAITLAEFGLRRAQGPDGGFSATKYSLIAGFDATSNVQAGKLLGVPIVGTHAHAYVQAHIDLNDAKDVALAPATGGEEQLLLPIVLGYREKLGTDWLATNDGELAAFINYAAAFPSSCLCLVDTYDTLKSGVRNFILVCLALDDLGYVPKGIRLDSGDLSYFSLEAAKMFLEASVEFKRPFFTKMSIAASNDINEEVLTSLNKQGHAINVFGIGTNLVTCQGQPALGCVYKLVEINGTPRMKVSQMIEKVLIPGRKESFRIYGVQGWPLLDLMICEGEEPPKEGERILCRHPFDEKKRVAVIPKRITRLHELVFDGNAGIVGGMCSMQESKERVRCELSIVRPDILRAVNPGTYKVSVSENLFQFLHTMWQEETPVMELR